jgi:glycosyltransferase involved in cell wall biosynthesis
MKVLHVIDSGGLYGAEIMLLHLMTEQVQIGLEPVLASIGRTRESEKPIEAQARNRGLRVKTFRMHAGPNFYGAYEILNFARQERIELIHSHGYKGNILFGLLPRRMRRIPLVSTVHGWTWVGGFNRMFLYEWLDSLSLRFVDQAVVVNGSMKIHPRIPTCLRWRAEVVENGIPWAEAKDGNSMRPDIVDFAQGGFTVCSIGRLSPEKGYGLLVEAAASLIREGRNLKLALLGEGELRGYLEKKAVGLGLKSHVYFPGYVENARHYLPLFGLFAMPSLTEGLPMVLLEAMNEGVPIVATLVGGIPEVLDEGRAGLLIRPGDIDDLKRAIIAVMDDVGSAQERAKAAKRRVRELYSSRAMAEKYGRIYTRLLLERAPAATN